MSQNPLVDLDAQSSKTTGLKPALAAALASLEVTLDQELARYRRTKPGYKVPSQPREGVSIISKPQDLTVINITESKNPTAEESGKVHRNEFEAATATTPTSASVQQEETSIVDETNTPFVETPKPEEQHNHKTPSNPQPTETPVTSKSSSSSIVPAVLGERQSEPSTQPEDFLESSEALLRSLVDEQPSTQSRVNSKQSLLSPLGIGSILLLILASLSLGYIMLSPKSWPQFNLDSLWKRKTAEPGNNSTTAHDEPKLTPIPKYPNLAESEFPEVRDPNDIVGLKPKAQPTTVPSPYPLVTQNPTNITTTAPHPQPLVPSINSLPIPTATSPSLSSPNPQAQIEPSKDGFYHIITENQGVSTFSAARKIIHDAYLSTDGKYIYLGAVKNQQKAQQLVQQLQAQGINARIQQP
jgi:hypothetical protein